MLKSFGLILFSFIVIIASGDLAVAGDLEFRNTFESYFSYGYSEVLNGEMNPGNRVLGLANQAGTFDLRDSFDI